MCIPLDLKGIMLSFLTYFSGTVCVLYLLVLKALSKQCVVSLSLSHTRTYTHATFFCGVRLISFTCKMHFRRLTGRKSMTRIKRYGKLDCFCVLVVGNGNTTWVVAWKCKGKKCKQVWEIDCGGWSSWSIWSLYFRCTWDYTFLFPVRLWVYERSYKFMNLFAPSEVPLGCLQLCILLVQSLYGVNSVTFFLFASKTSNFVFFVIV